MKQDGVYIYIEGNVSITWVDYYTNEINDNKSFHETGWGVSDATSSIS